VGAGADVRCKKAHFSTSPCNGGRFTGKLVRWHASGRAFVLTIVLVSVSTIGTMARASEPDNRNFQRRPAVCPEQYAPVCGQINGVRKIYSNSCFAAADGAKVIVRGPCK